MLVLVTLYQKNIDRSSKSSWLKLIDSEFMDSDNEQLK